MSVRLFYTVVFRTIYLGVAYKSFTGCHVHQFTVSQLKGEFVLERPSATHKYAEAYLSTRGIAYRSNLDFGSRYFILLFPFCFVYYCHVYYCHVFSH